MLLIYFCNFQSIQNLNLMDGVRGIEKSQQKVFPRGKRRFRLKSVPEVCCVNKWRRILCQSNTLPNKCHQMRQTSSHIFGRPSRDGY